MDRDLCGDRGGSFLADRLQGGRGDAPRQVWMEEMMEITHLSLFSGVGGLDLAAEWAGIQTVGQCEWAEYPTKVLERHWPDVPRWKDIKTLTGESFYERTGRRTVDIISGGFPCQPFSGAGKRRGKEDDRYLWPEMLRVIEEIRPKWVVGENVSGLIRGALTDILSDLKGAGYEARAYSSEARNVGGLFRGERIAIVAASYNGITFMRGNRKFSANEENEGSRNNNRAGKEKPDLWERWQIEPRPYGVADGVPYRVDRLKCLGNAVVPQQFYPIFRAISDIEEAYQSGQMPGLLPMLE